MKIPPPLGYGESATRAREAAQEARRRAWAAWGTLRPLFPSFVDLHVYGGGALVAWGAWSAWEPLGLIAFGSLLLYLGLWRS
jgi:hypothetical protein